MTKEDLGRKILRLIAEESTEDADATIILMSTVMTLFTLIRVPKCEVERLFKISIEGYEMINSSPDIKTAIKNWERG